MTAQYNRNRYDDNLGYRILHISGTNTGETALPYLHHCLNYMLLYFKCGKGSIKIEGHHYNLNEGDVIVLNPSELFQITIDDSVYHERMTFNLSESMLAAFPGECNSLFELFYQRKKGIGNRVPAQKIRESGLDKYFDEILEFARSKEHLSPLLTFCRIAQLLEKLGKLISYNYSYGSEQTILNPLISDVLCYLNLHFTEDICIAEIAEEFNVDRSYLSHLFKEHVGMSLWTYVISRRIQLFNSLIRQNYSVEETCYKAGFQNYSNFFRLYKKHMNMTPTQFRNQIKSGEKLIINPL